MKRNTVDENNTVSMKRNIKSNQIIILANIYFKLSFV